MPEKAYLLSILLFYFASFMLKSFKIQGNDIPKKQTRPVTIRKG